VQSAYRVNRSEGGSRATSAGLKSSVMQMLTGTSAGAQLPALMLPTAPPFDCASNPHMCRAPFNCQSWGQKDRFDMMLNGVGKSGHANLRFWCDHAQYGQNLVKECLVNQDLKRSAQVVFDWTVAREDGTDLLDASYCFIEGHCTNTAVTDNTTLEEAEAMCDERLGHEAWASSFLTKPALMAQLMEVQRKGGMDRREGFRHTLLTGMFLKFACSMGNYHCDVQYCKHTYCQKEYYVKKFAHLLPKAPGHLIQQREWL